MENLVLYQGLYLRWLELIYLSEMDVLVAV